MKILLLTFFSLFFVSVNSANNHDEDPLKKYFDELRVIVTKDKETNKMAQFNQELDSIFNDIYRLFEKDDIFRVHYYIDKLTNEIKSIQNHVESGYWMINSMASAINRVDKGVLGFITNGGKIKDMCERMEGYFQSALKTVETLKKTSIELEPEVEGRNQEFKEILEKIKAKLVRNILSLNETQDQKQIINI